MNFRDSTYFTKSANFLVPFRINGTAVTSSAAELNILDGALATYTELNYLVGVTSNLQTQLNAKQATLVSGTNIKTVNGTSLLGSGNVVIDSAGGSMVYPGAGIPISTGTEWGTSITNNSAQWDSAYVGRLRWDGGAIGLTAATGRTSLGGTTVGQNLFTLTNPDAIRFLRINADNTVTALSAANFKTALSLTSSDVGLGNVTNESKTTMFTSPTFTTSVNLAATTYVPSGGTINFNTSGGYMSYNATDDDLYIGNMGVQLLTGTLGKELAPVSKGWFTDLDVNNTITGSISGNAATVTGFTRNSGTITLTGGHGITFTTTGITSVTLPTSGTLATTTQLANDTTTLHNYFEARVDSIVDVLADTMNIETLLQIDLDTDTIADLSELRLRVLRADSTDVFATPMQISDTITARIAAATVGVAAADSNIYAGYTTRTYVESLLGSGEGLSAKRLPFIIGVTTGAPSAADTIVVHSEFEGKHIDLYRDGAKQYQHFTATNTLEGFRLSNDTIYVNPAWQANEQILVDIIEPILWSYLSLEGQESTLLDSLNGYWKFDETSGTSVIDAVGMQDGTTNATANVVGKLGRAREFDAATDVVNIAYNANTVPSGADFSVAMWFKIDSLPSVTSRENYLFQQNVGASPWSAHYVYVDDDDDKIHVGSRNSSGTVYNVISTDAISVDTWYHVVFVNRGDGETLQLYVNGSDVSASAGTFSGTLIVAASTTCFGNSYSGAGAYLDGIIDSPGIWNKALTSDEVTELYNSGNGVTYPFN